MDDLNAPATKGDLQKFATKDDLQLLGDRLTETMRDIQTEMLKAFTTMRNPPTYA
jgi:hypothetical protein